MLGEVDPEGDDVNVGEAIGFGDVLVGVTERHGSVLSERVMLEDKMTFSDLIVCLL